jgi:hypothetical protein
MVEQLGDRMWFSVAGMVLGALIVHAWWLETYTDSPLARSWRRMSAAWSPTRNAQAMLRPCTGLMLVFGGVGVVLEEVGGPRPLLTLFAFLALLSVMIGVVYLLPLPLPHFADPRYQYLKRHGLLDATGRPLPDEVINRILAQREGHPFL